MYFAHRRDSVAVGASATHNDDIRALGSWAFPQKPEFFLKPALGGWRTRSRRLFQQNDCSARSTEEEFAIKLEPLETSPELWASRQQVCSPEDVRRCQCELGDLRLLATAPRPDICARLAKLASKVYSQQSAVLKFASASHPKESAR